MLKIIYGDIVNCDNFIYDPDSYFNRFREDEWVAEDLAKEMILDIDKSEVLDNHLIKSPILGLIPPQYLSGGVKTLIMIYNMPDLIFNATWCGENCAKWLLKIGEKKDIIINLEYNMAFPKSDSKVLILNNNKLITKTEDLDLEAALLIRKDVSYVGGEVINEGEN